MNLLDYTNENTGLLITSQRKNGKIVKTVELRPVINKKPKLRGVLMSRYNRERDVNEYYYR